MTKMNCIALHGTTTSKDTTGTIFTEVGFAVLGFACKHHSNRENLIQYEKFRHMLLIESSLSGCHGPQ